MHYHKALGQKAGLSEAQIQDLERFEQSSAYSDLEKLVLRFADQWTRQGKASPEVVKELTKSLSPAQWWCSRGRSAWRIGPTASMKHSESNFLEVQNLGVQNLEKMSNQRQDHFVTCPAPWTSG
jgi:hypothetical protein